jgi:hypothetical protein
MSGTQRAVLRAGAFLMILSALLAFGLAVRPTGTGSGPAKVAVPAGQAVSLPVPRPFGSRPVLYGAVPAGQDAPGAKELGCTVHSPSGNGDTIFDLAWANNDPKTVDGTRLTALVSFGSYPRGTTLTCDGQAASTAQPMYLLNGGKPMLLRVGLIGYGLMAVLVGTVGAILLRPRRRPNSLAPRE